MTFPIVWVAVELLRSRFVPGASWGSIAYTQYGWLTLTQMATFAGIAGIAFLIAWFASTLQWSWSHGFQWNAVRTPVLIYVVTFTLIILAGAIRISMAPTDLRFAWRR
jgi:apolipoprotein N-acyltransferase